jgi:hypothetical protein
MAGRAVEVFVTPETLNKSPVVLSLVFSGDRSSTTSNVEVLVAAPVVALLTKAGAGGTPKFSTSTTSSRLLPLAPGISKTTRFSGFTVSSGRSYSTCTVCRRGSRAATANSGLEGGETVLVRRWDVEGVM